MIDIYDYTNCFYCDNLIAHPDIVGLLYLGFPRCFILVRNKDEYFGAKDYDTFMKNSVVEINWLDPNERASEADKETVLIKLWNFSVAQEDMEDELYEPSNTQFNTDAF